MTDPAFRQVLLGGLPGLMRESVLPLGAFVIASAVAGLGAGIGSSPAVSVLVYLHERRSGRDGLVVRLALVFVAVQSVIGLAAHSATAYLAQPVLFNAAWGLAFVAQRQFGARSPARSRARGTRSRTRFAPLIASSVSSVVWGVYLLARSALRLTILLVGTIGGFAAVVFVTGMRVMVARSIQYAIRHLQADTDAASAAARRRPSARVPGWRDDGCRDCAIAWSRKATGFVRARAR
jgi:hypothetical protein